MLPTRGLGLAMDGEVYQIRRRGFAWGASCRNRDRLPHSMAGGDGHWSPWLLPWALRRVQLLSSFFSGSE